MTSPVWSMNPAPSKEGYTITNEGNKAIYRKKNEGLEDGYPIEDTVVSTFGITHEDYDFLQIVDFEYSTEARNDQVQITEAMADYWVKIAENEKWEKMQIHIPGTVIVEMGYWENASSLLAAAQLGFSYEDGKAINIHSDEPTVLLMSTKDYRKHKSTIESVKKHIANKQKEDASFNFQDTLEIDDIEVSSILLTDGHLELPFYSGRILWEGFTGYIGFYNKGNSYKVKLYEKTERGLEFAKRINLSLRDLEKGLNEVEEAIRDDMGLKNAIKVPCVNLHQLLIEQEKFLINTSAAEDIMGQFVEKGISYRAVEAEIVKKMKSEEGGYVKPTDFMFTRGFCFPLLNQTVCVSYIPFGDRNRLHTLVAETKEEVADFYQMVVKEEIMSQ